MEATTSGNDQSSIVEVLFEFKESRKPLSIPRDALLQRVERELALCVGDACLLPPGMNLSDVASSSKKSFFLLQRWSQKWNAFIDVASVEDVKDADKITVVPAFAPACGAEDVRQKASDVCKRLGKPSSSDAKVLSRLFPSSVSRPPKRPLKAFDPASECVALVQQKKKKAFKSKPSNVEVIMVCDKSTIPRGKARKMLDDQGKVQKIEFRREMSNREVTNCVLRNFDHVHNLIGFTLLETDRGGKLHPSQNEKPDGEYIIVDGRRKSGPIYIYPILREDAVKDTMDEIITNQDEAVGLIQQEIQDTGVKSDETRALRESLIAEQNVEFEKSLKIDSEKVKVNAQEREKKEKMEEMREFLKLKFCKNEAKNAPIHLAFRFPDGRKLDHHFHLKNTTMELYEFVFAVGEVDQPYKVYEGYPRMEIKPSTTDTLNDIPVISGCLLSVEYVDDANSFDIIQQAQCKEKKRSELEKLQKAEEERDHFMSSMCSSSGPPHEINRGDLFNNVLHLFASDDITKEYPLRIRFKGELAIDTGGVMRDMVSAFWEIAYEKCCDGDSLLVPLIHPGSDTSMFTKLGRILSHGYMQCGFLPLKIAFLFLLLCCLELR